MRHADNWNVARHLRETFPHPYTRADAEKWVAHNLAAEGPVLDFAITLDGEAIGGVGLMRKSDIFRCGIELGYWLGQPFWGRGLVAEAVSAVAAYAFATFPELAVVQARHMATNPASGRVLAKAGFRLDGRLRDAAVKSGVVADVLVYSLTRAEVGAATAAAAGSPPTPGAIAPRSPADSSSPTRR